MNYIANCHRFLGCLKKETKGTSAIEFALIFPILILVYFGLVEISNSLEVKRKVENAANLTGMLVAQAEAVDADFMTNVYKASKMAFEPLDVAPLKVRISSVFRELQNDGSFINKVAWSDGDGLTALAVGSVLNPPDNILGDNRGIIVTEVEYKYARILPETSFTDFFPSGDIVFTRTFWAHPRYVISIPFQ